MQRFAEGLSVVSHNLEGELDWRPDPPSVQNVAATPKRPARARRRSRSQRAVEATSR